VDTAEEELVEHFLDLIDRDVEAGRSIGDLPASLERSMLAVLGKPLDLQKLISGAVEI